MFGCRWASDLPLDAFHPTTTADRAHDITVTHCFDAAPARANPTPPKLAQVAADGVRLHIPGILTADSFGPNRIEIRTEPAFTGELPPGFFGTLTGAVLAWRGLLPMHGSAVLLDNKAILICGASGAGKSTFTAALLAAGARFLSDDLTVLHPRAESAPAIFAGRRSLRLYPITANWLAAHAACKLSPLLEDGKHLVTPTAADPSTAFPLAAIVLLGESSAEADTLHTHVYRPKITATLPWHFARESQLRNLTRSVPAIHLPRMEARDTASLDALSQHVDLLRNTLRIHLA